MIHTCYGMNMTIEAVDGIQGKGLVGYLVFSRWNMLLDLWDAMRIPSLRSWLFSLGLVFEGILFFNVVVVAIPRESTRYHVQLYTNDDIVLLRPYGLLSDLTECD